jgi:hypothetical protein
MSYLDDLPRDAAGITAMDIDSFLKLELPPRCCLMSPWLPSSGLTEVYATRGLGKTYFALNVGYAVAAGTEFLGWKCPTPKRVLYIDGEMPASDMQERLKSIRRDNTMVSGNFKLITPDLHPYTIPNLATLEGQLELKESTDQADLIIVDNISTLCRTGKENESDNWTPVQQWALKMRSEGRSVLFVHHANKNGGQRGTSGREDVLDTVIALRRPKGSSPTESANFEVHFEKNRGFTGEDAREFSATMSIDNGEQKWVRQSLVDSSFDRCVTLTNNGASGAEIAEKLGINKSNVSRHQKNARAKGLLKETQAE